MKNCWLCSYHSCVFINWSIVNHNLINCWSSCDQLLIFKKRLFLCTCVTKKKKKQTYKQTNKQIIFWSDPGLLVRSMCLVVWNWKWRHLVTKFGKNATHSSATEINLEISNLNFPYFWICQLCSWKNNSSYRSNAWVRCASGNVYYPN